MFYITNGNSYYCGKCCSDNRTPVWKSCPTRALSFKSVEEALMEFGDCGEGYPTIRYIMGDCDYA